MSGRTERVTAFLYREAQLLDRAELDAWLTMIAPSIEYRVPVRSTRYGRPEGEFSTTSFHFDEDFYSLSKRVERLKSLFAWAEDPPTRTRHFVTNVCLGDDGDDTDVVTVHSNLMLVRTRSDSAQAEVLTGERTDRLRVDAASVQIASRLVHLDQTTLPVGTISTFL